MTMKPLLLFMGLMFATTTYTQTSGFARGADISWCTEMESDGRVFRNAEGAETDIFDMIGLSHYPTGTEWNSTSPLGYT